MLYTSTANYMLCPSLKKNSPNLTSLSSLNPSTAKPLTTHFSESRVHYYQTLTTPPSPNNNMDNPLYPHQHACTATTPTLKKTRHSTQFRNRGKDSIQAITQERNFSIHNGTSHSHYGNHMHNQSCDSAAMSRHRNGKTGLQSTVQMILGGTLELSTPLPVAELHNLTPNVYLCPTVCIQQPGTSLVHWQMEDANGVKDFT